MNSFTLVGNLGQNPQSINTNGGERLSKINIAVGSRKDQLPDWYNNLECWGKIAEIVDKHCYQGRKVSVKGYIALNKWEDKDTKEINEKLSFKVTKIQLLDKKNTTKCQSEQEYQELGY